MLLNHLTFFGLCLFLSCSTVVLANEQTHIKQGQRYQSSHFNQFNAQHALDMVTLTPGFVLIEGSTERGLANSSGNVLINGVPAQSKTESLTDLLEKLSAEQVEFIDVYTSNHPFSSVSQHTQAINITTKKNQTTVDIQSSLALRDKQRSQAQLQTQLRTPWLGWQHQLSTKVQNSRYRSHYFANEFDQQTALIEQQTEDFIEQLRQFQVDTQSSTQTQHGNLQLSSKLLSERWQTDFEHAHFEPNNPVAFKQLTTTEWMNFDEYQLGFDWQTTLNNAFTIQWLGLSSDNKQVTHIRESNATQAPFTQSKTRKEHATQLSIQANTWPLEPQFGIEFSYNQQRSKTELDALHIHNRVSETRYQPFSAIHWQVSSDWQLYAKLNIEFSQLTTGQQAQNPLKTHHIKPLVRLSYSANNWDLTGQFKQHVEQLDFDLFVATQDISFGRTQLGNNSLKPSRYSELSVQVNYTPNEYLTLNNTLFSQWQRDIHESMLLGNNEEGVANAGSARLYGIDSVIDINTDFILTNSTLTIDYQYRHARYNDPLSGQRAINNLTPHTLNAEFRHNFNTLSWGLEYTAKQHLTEYFVSETVIERDAPNTSLFLEIPLLNKLTLRVEANTVEKYQYRQQFYQAKRGGAQAGYQITHETVDPELRLTLRSQL
ncbi:hypothetical protein PSECIP111951_02903 [Pseudoalteromonas holothuriae]|uniref:Outer membrane protein beta-barrel domain-containing protein n=1 Tax=Pseudoalteromonas holothuriae TaxID=2963714 RepID=A0ABM9GKK5_9GAMM|nr:hypothetical protein [Pseudoalteromonas sp. CIP111951]CAH9063439.1 hypothetical protein PSECIP111951_02903 [Pseudoalteromonas sp. CIP111951]